MTELDSYKLTVALPTLPAPPIPAPMVSPEPKRGGLGHGRWQPLLIVLAAVGPGLMVMLADTDAGSVVTAAQSGAKWGFDLLP